MKNFRFYLLIACFTFFNQKGFAQEDSVYYTTNNKLFSEVKIISVEGNYGFRENYTFFKSTYWLTGIDTILLEDIKNPGKETKNYADYKILNDCDSTINVIRNRASFQASYSEIKQLASEAIGQNNVDFENFKEQENAKFRNFAKYCSNEFNEMIEQSTNRQKEIIEQLKANKIEFYNYIKKDQSSIDSEVIADFLMTFNACETDFKSIEFIILNYSQAFVKLVNLMTEKSFKDLVRKLNFLPAYIDIRAIKKILKNSPDQTLRTKVLRKSIKKSKAE